MLDQTRKLGPMQKVMSMIPGMGAMKDMIDGEEAEQEMRRLRGVIDSMTPEERRNPRKTIDQSRRRRIAAGAGVEPHVVNDLVKQFDGMADMMKKVAGMGMRDRMRAMQEMQQGGLMNPGAKLMKEKGGTGKRLTAAEKAKQRKLREKMARKRKREGKDRGNSNGKHE
jgi:signal recognition particle subunit SRP54